MTGPGKPALGEPDAAQPPLYAFRLLAGQRAAPHELALVQPHQPAEASLQRGRALIDVAAVECVAHLEAKRVTRSKSGRRHRDLTLQQGSPHGRSVSRLDVQLEPVLARVTRTTDHGGHTGDLPLGEMIEADPVQVSAGERRQHVASQRALQREERDPVALVVQLGLEVAGEPRDVCPVLLDVGRVHDEAVFALAHPVYDQVVHDPAVLPAHGAVLGLTDLQPCGIVGRDVGDEIEGLRSGDRELAHVRDVEQPGRIAHRLVLRPDAGGILHGHREAAERHEPGVQANVLLVERCGP